MNSDRLRELRNQYRSGLLEDVLPFWIRHGIDREHGGYFSALNRDGSLLDSDKSVWVQGRFSWLLATLYSTVEQNSEWLELAKHGLDFLDRYGSDPSDDLMWFHLTKEGSPLRKRRYRFSEAFACLANAAYYGATKEPSYAEKAVRLFDTFWKHWHDPGLAPGLPKFEPTRPAKSLGNPMIGLNMAQVCREAGIEGVWDARIDACIREIRDDFVHDDIECVMETVSPDGSRLNNFNGRTLNPGHAIEGVWFILQEAKHRGNDADLISLGTKMLDWMWKRGWDQEYGGILYFVGVDGKPVEEYWHDMKFWWPQNETIIATLLAHFLTGEEKYAEMHQKIHDWTYAHFPDSEYGEWYGYLHRDGSVSVPLKGNLWKGPFHIPRMQWKCWQLCEEWLHKSSP
ncbi:MAG: AGE family epimerase/isomerase [Verrucomicrobia bacterium]|nr:AGE family epimerase/isomerase [Verrucomicrobiota bacterium]